MTTACAETDVSTSSGSISVMFLEQYINVETNQRYAQGVTKAFYIMHKEIQCHHQPRHLQDLPLKHTRHAWSPSCQLTLLVRHINGPENNIAVECILSGIRHANGERMSCSNADEGRKQLLEVVTEMASRGLRTLCLAYADVSANTLGPLAKLDGAPPPLPLTVCCMLGIKVSPTFTHPSLRCLYELDAAQQR